MKTSGKILSLDLTKGNKQCIVNFAENPIFKLKITSLSTTVLSLNIPVPIQRRPRTILEGTGSYQPSPIETVFSSLQTGFSVCVVCNCKDLFDPIIKSLPKP